MFDHIWPKQRDKAERVKFLLTRAILIMAAFWVIVTLSQIIEILVNGPAGTYPAQISIGGPGMTLALLCLGGLAFDIAIALTALRSLNRSIAGKVSRVPLHLRRFGLLLFFYFSVAAVIIGSYVLSGHLTHYSRPPLS